MNLYIGIDVSKHKHDVAIMTADKKLIGKTFVIGENADGYGYLAARIKQLQQQYQVYRIYIGMEATADYWKNLFHFLKQQPHCIPVVINPVKTRAFAKTELRRAKTDPVNAKDIARFMVEKKPAASYYRPAVLDSIKDIHSQISVLKKQQSMLGNRLRHELGKVAPEIEQHFRYIQGIQILAILSRFPTAEAIAQLEPAELQQLRYGQQQRRISAPFFRKLQALAQHSIGFKSGPGAGFVVQSLIRSISHCHSEIELITAQINQLYQSDGSENAALLASIKGVTKEQAIILDAYFGDVTRFYNERAFVAFFGMNAVIDKSGQSKRHSHLEKKGSGVVRRILYQITLTLTREQVDPFYRYYQRLVDRGKPKLVAMCAVMRKLLVIMYKMLINREKFNPNH
jgi:transposase